jgi:molybdopterin-synthase adenylyltransferase
MTAEIESLRYSRHALLAGFDEEGVEAVRASRALVIGAGGLGCPAATYLVASGIGCLHWVDGDVVDATNLARQTLFGPQDIGKPKVEQGAKALAKINSQVKVIAEHRFADSDFLNTAVPLADVVLDCTDQWKIRQAINKACVAHGVALVSAAAIEWSGQLLVVNPSDSESACYACVFDPAHEPAAHACGAYGVLAPLVGAMGCLQVAEALKLIVGKANGAMRPASPQKLSLFDMKSGDVQQLLVKRNPRCPVCSHLSSRRGP